jgi:hypothetical protein
MEAITPSNFGVDVAVAPKWRPKSDHVSLQNLQQMQLVSFDFLCSLSTKRGDNRHCFGNFRDARDQVISAVGEHVAAQSPFCDQGEKA